MVSKAQTTGFGVIAASIIGGLVLTSSNPDIPPAENFAWKAGASIMVMGSLVGAMIVVGGTKGI